MAANKTLDERSSDIVAHAYKNAPATKQRLDAAGVKPRDITTAADLLKIPVMAKDEVVQLQAENPPFGGMLAVPVSELKWVFISPGPLYEGEAHPEKSIARLAELMQTVGFGKGDVLLNSLSYHLVPFGQQFDAAMRAVGGMVLPVGIGNTALQVKMMLDFGATAYSGTPSFLMTLIEKTEEFGVDFSQTRLKKAIVSAEPLPPSLRDRLESYDINVINVYGTAELGSIGYEVTGEEGFVLMDDSVVQVCDPVTGEALPDGEEGEVVVTNFNETYPLIRFGTGDLSAFNPDNGRLVGWLGRVGAAVKVRGMFVHPNQLEEVLAGFPNVADFQAIIGRDGDRDTFDLRVVLSADVDRDALTTKLIKAVPTICRVKPDMVTFVDGIAEDEPKVIDARSWE